MTDFNLTGMNLIIPQDVQSVFEKPPQGTILWRIVSAKGVVTEPQDGTQGRLVYEVSLEGLAPEQAAGITWDHGFWLGTKDDPLAQNPATLKKEAAHLVKFCEEVGFDPRNCDLSQLGTQGFLPGRRVLADCRHYYVPLVGPNGQPNPKAMTDAGARRSRVVLRFMKEGAATPQIDVDQAPVEGRAAKAAVAAQPTATQPPIQAAAAPAPSPQPPIHQPVMQGAAPAGMPSAGLPIQHMPPPISQPPVQHSIPRS